MICVTGAYGGYGVEVAKALGRRGRTLLLCGRKQESLADLKKEVEALGGVAHALHLDLSSASTVNQFEEELKALGVDKIEALIHCSGAGHNLMRALDFTETGYLSQMQINGLGPYQLTRVLAPYLMKGTRKRVVFVSSVSALAHIFHQAAYSISKKSLDRLVDHLRTEFAELQISVVWPGLTDTDMVGKKWRQMPILPPSHVAECLVKMAESSLFIREMMVLSSIQKTPNFVHYPEGQS